MEEPPVDCVHLTIQQFAERYECTIVSPRAIHRLKKIHDTDNMVPAVISLRMNGLFSGNCMLQEQSPDKSPSTNGETDGKWDHLVPILKENTEKMALDGFVLGFGLCLSHHDYQIEKKAIERIYKEMKQRATGNSSKRRAILPEPLPSAPLVIHPDNIYEYDADPDFSTKNIYDGDGHLVGSPRKRKHSFTQDSGDKVRTRHEFDDLIKKYNKPSQISVKYIDPREIVILRQKDLVSGAFRWFVYKPIYYHAGPNDNASTIQIIIETIGLPNCNNFHKSPSQFLCYHRLTNIQIFLLNEPSSSTNEPISHVSRLMKENETLDIVIESYRTAIRNNALPIHPIETLPKHDKDGPGKKNPNPYPYGDHDNVNYGLMEEHLDQGAYIANHLNEQDVVSNDLFSEQKQPMMVERALTQAQQQMITPDYAKGARSQFKRNVKELQDEGAAQVQAHSSCDASSKGFHYVRLPEESKVGHVTLAQPPPDMIELLDRRIRNIFIGLGLPEGVSQNYSMMKTTTSGPGTGKDNLSGGQTTSILSTAWQLYSEEQMRYLQKLSVFMNNVLQHASSKYSALQTQKFQNKRVEMAIRYCQSEDDPEDAFKREMARLGHSSEHRLTFVLEPKGNTQQLTEMYENCYVRWDSIKEIIAKEINKPVEEMETDPIVERARREKLIAKAQAEAQPKETSTSSSG